MRIIVKYLIVIMLASGCLMAEFSEKDIYEDVEFSRNIIIQRSIIEISKQYEKKFSKKITVKDFYESFEVFFAKVKKSDKNVDVKLLYHFFYAIKFSPNLLNEFTSERIKDISNLIDEKLKKDSSFIQFSVLVAFVDTIKATNDISNFAITSNKLIMENNHVFLKFAKNNFNEFMFFYLQEIIQYKNTEMINISYQHFKNNFDAITEYYNNWDKVLILLQLCKNNKLEIKELFLKIPDEILDGEMSPSNKKTYREYAKELGLFDFDKKSS